jgi:hypothetical protein
VGILHGSENAVFPEEGCTLPLIPMSAFLASSKIKKLETDIYYFLS